MPETTFDHMVRGQEIYEVYSRENRLNWWHGRSDGEYCILRAAHIAYMNACQELSELTYGVWCYRPYPGLLDKKYALERIVDSHWKTFAMLSWLYARMDK